jgi:thioredoxin 1
MSAKPITVTSENFEAEVLRSALPVVVDLWAPWCGPCRNIAPILEELAIRYEGQVKVAKVNVDEEPSIASAFQVQSIPTLAVLYQGALFGSVVGFGGRASIEEMFTEVAQLPAKVAADSHDEVTHEEPLDDAEPID